MAGPVHTSTWKTAAEVLEADYDLARFSGRGDFPGEEDDNRNQDQSL